MTAGAIIGAAIGAFALAGQRGKGVVVGVPPDSVAIVNGVSIARSDFDAELLARFKTDPSHATPVQKKEILNFLVDQELYVELGKKLGVDEVDTDLRAALFSAVEAQVTADALTAEVDEATLRKYYDQHSQQYAGEGFLTVRDFVFPASTAPDGEKIAAAIKAARGAPAAAAKFGGRDTNRVKGEEFYFAAKIHLGDAMFAKAVALPTGAVSSPIMETDGLHVMYVVKNTLPIPTKFEDVSSDVRRDYTKEAADKLRNGEDSFFRRRANILIAGDLK
jgi:hypothetical protein